MGVLITKTFSRVSRGFRNLNEMQEFVYQVHIGRPIEFIYNDRVNIDFVNSGNH